MLIFWRRACALTLAAAVSAGVSAQDIGLVSFEDGAVVAAAGGPVDTGGAIQQTSCDACGEYGDCGCGSDSLMSGGLVGGRARRGSPFVGAEYLSVRANFSEATAFRNFNAADFSETFEQFDFDYGDSYRIYGGWRLCDCGAEIRFTYTNFSSDGGFGPAVEDADPLNTITSPFEVVTGGDGDTLSGTATVDVDNFDFGFARTIPLGSPLGCNTCGDCVDPCGCDVWCPAWDVQWTGGIRVANVDSQLDYASNIVSGSTVPNRTASSTVSFDGVGLRSGLIGRRYLGRSGFASVFIRGDISLLVGEVDVVAEGSLFPATSISTTEVIPVTELEGGGTIYLTPNLQFSGGYLLSAWHDLGHRIEYDFGTTGTSTLSADDANMMMFDGWFLRLEATF